MHVLESSSGSRLDIFANAKLGSPSGLYGLRVNVDNLDEVVAFVESIGFVKKSEYGDTASNRSVFMQLPTELKCYFIEHIK